MSLAEHLPLKNRQEAGRLLAAELDFLRQAGDLLVLGLPRGGVPVAYEVAQALKAPLDIFVVRKIGLPGQSEYAIGAIASGGVQVMDALPPGLVRQADVQAVIGTETDELKRREQVYRGTRAPLDPAGRTVLLVDDGLATGATMEAAVRALRRLNPRRLAVAVPIASREAAARLRPLVDDLVCGATPEPFRAVSLWYREFAQTTDEEVQSLLDGHPAGASSAAA